MKYTIAVTFAILTMNASIAQITELDTVYYNLQGGKVSKFENYATYEVGQVDFRERLEGTARRYSKAGRLIEQSEYEKGVKNGQYFRIGITGNILLYGEYAEGKKVGFWVTNNVEGMPIKTADYGKKGELNEVTQISEPIYTANDYDQIDSSPKFPGGAKALAKFLKKNLRYPSELKAQKIPGVVNISFIVLSNGIIVNPVPVEGYNQFTVEGMKVMRKMPKWIPASKNGKPIHSEARLRLTFTAN